MILFLAFTLGSSFLSHELGSKFVSEYPGGGLAFTEMVKPLFLWVAEVGSARSWDFLWKTFLIYSRSKTKNLHYSWEFLGWGLIHFLYTKDTERSLN